MTILYFNPATRTLQDENGRLLKQLNCAKGASSKEIQGGICSLCERPVISLDGRTMSETINMLLEEPQTCISFEIDAPFIRITPHDPT